MDDTLLTSLCKICHIDPPKYTCPRCLAETCSLTCSKRHKIWSSCNGVRDATAYKPISEVATPSGIDHDYNFLHAIEHGISRSEKVLIEDLGLVTNEELKRARLGDDGHAPRKRQKVHNDLPGEACIRKVLDENKITIRTAPRGMRRNRENTTGWSRKRKTIDWQVEWLRDAPAGRTLYRVSGNRPIGEQYEALCEEERRMNMTDDERREAKKKKAYEVKMRAAKKRGDGHDLFAAAVALLQDPDTGTWCKLSSVVEPTQVLVNECVPVRVPPTYHLYLHRPLTLASFPKVIVPIDVRRSLTDLLANRELLEYPTIYVLEQDPHHLPSTFMLEVDYLAATGARCAGDTGLVSGKGPGNDDETSSYSDATETMSSSSNDSSSSDEERVE